MGERGLMYRHRFGRESARWRHLGAIPVRSLRIRVGAGDWCTAGFIANATAGGQDGLRRAGARGVRDALRYGQTLAAWSCSFEGARGGMYAVARRTFDGQIASLLGGRWEAGISASREPAAGNTVGCPACSTSEARETKSMLAGG